MQSSVPGKSLDKKQQLQTLQILQVVLAPWLNLQEDALKKNVDELEAALIPLTVYHPISPIQMHVF